MGAGFAPTLSSPEGLSHICRGEPLSPLATCNVWEIQYYVTRELGLVMYNNLILVFFSITTELFFLNPSDSSKVYLGYENILIGSDSVWKDEKLLQRDSVYIIDYNKGVIRFKEVTEETLRVKFSHLDFPVNKTYRRWNPAPVDSSIKRMIGIDSNEKGNLIIHGNKGIFMDASHTGTNVTQSLWMKIGGKTGNFNISGVLSDENIPEGKGASQNIREIDEIYIEAISPALSFRLGDIQDINHGVQKRLFGLNATWKSLSDGGLSDGDLSGIDPSGISISGVAGISRGKYGKYTFRGEEGKQGPYRLLIGNSNTDFTIIQGSEQVFLDGRLLKGGIENDYVVDYSFGSITFGPSVFIDDESTILVLFEYHPYGSENLFYKVNLEGKDASLSLTREEGISEIDRFDQVYPDSGFGYVYSSTCVGEGNGDYDFLDSFFVYRGYRNGSYYVYFEWVGEGKGEYIYIDSLHSFNWTGDGEWSAKRKVELPIEDNLLLIEYNNNLGPLSFEGDVKARRYRNLFGGSINDGASGDFSATYSPNRFIQLHADYYRRSPQFITQEWEGSREIPKIWEMDEIPPYLAEYSISITPIPRIKSSYLWGKAGSTRRDRIRTEFSPFYIQWGRIEGIREEARGGFHQEIIDFYLHQIKRGSNYRREAILESKPLYLCGGLEGNENGDTSRIYTIRTDITFKNTTLKASHRRREAIETGEIKSISNGTLLTDVQLWFLLLKEHISLSHQRTTRFERYYQEVDMGEGEYSYDSINGTYYEDPYGDYILKVVPTDDEIDIREYSGNISFEAIQYIYLQGYLDFTYTHELFQENNISLIFKFPRSGENRFFLRYDGTYLNDKKGWMAQRRQKNNNIRLGLEQRRMNYREYGLKWDQSMDELKIGLYTYIWQQRGLEMDIEVIRINGEDTLYQARIKPGIHFSEKTIRGFIHISLGYNYYNGTNVTSERMRDLYPPDFFYDLTIGIKYDITKNFHLVLNGNLHRLSEGKIYYKGRLGITADFGE